MKFFNRENFLSWGFPTLIFLFICITGGFLQYFENVPSADVSARYAPMADAFRDGNWQYAFHPRIQPLMPAVGGIIAKLCNIDGFTAMKFAAIFFFALAIFPFYFLNLQLFDRKTALFSGIFYLFCSRLWLLSLTGLRDSGKIFALVLSAYALVMIYRQREKLSNYLLLALGVVLGANCRGDMIFIGGIFLMISYFMEYENNRFAKKSMIALAAVWLFMLPFVLINYHFFNAAVPEMRFGMWYKEYFGTLPDFKIFLLFSLAGIAAFIILMQILCRIPFKILCMVLPVLLTFVLIILSFRVIKSGSDYDTGDFFESLVVGFYPQYGFPALLGFYLMFRAKKMRKEHALVLFILFFHAIFLVMQIMFSEKTFYVSRRYLISAAPLYFGFSAWTLLDLRSKLAEYWQEKYSYMALAALCLTFTSIETAWFVNRLRKSFHSSKHQTIINAAAAIRGDVDYEKCKAEKSFPQLNYHFYTPSSPLIISYDADCKVFNVLPYCVNGRKAQPGEKIHYFITRDRSKACSGRIIAGLKFKKAEYFIVRQCDINQRIF